MMRVLELLMALVIVAVLAVVVGIAMPGSGHVERSLVIGKDTVSRKDKTEQGFLYP